MARPAYLGLQKCHGHVVVAMDTLYDKTAPPPRTQAKKEKAKFPNTRSAMDLNTSLGFRADHCFAPPLFF